MIQQFVYKLIQPPSQDIETNLWLPHSHPRSALSVVVIFSELELEFKKPQKTHSEQHKTTTDGLGFINSTFAWLL